MSQEHAIPKVTVVRSPSGALERRDVLAVNEWRIESAENSGALVLSIVTSCGSTQSFKIGHADAQDMAEVLRRKTRTRPGIHGTRLGLRVVAAGGAA